MYNATQKSIFLLRDAYIPSLPENVFKIQDEIQSAHPNLRKVASYISADGELALKFIELTKELVGSTVGSNPSIYTIVDKLGINTVYEIFVAAFLQRQVVRTPFDQKVMHMCRRCSVASYYLAQDSKLINQSEAYLTGLLHGISFIFLNRIMPDFEKHYRHFISNPQLYHQKLYDKHGFTTGHTDMIIANHWRMKRNQLKAYALAFSNQTDGVEFKRTHHKKAYQLSRVIMLAHIYANQFSQQGYIFEQLKALQLEIEQELTVTKETRIITQAALSNLNRILAQEAPPKITDSLDNLTIKNIA